MTVTRDVIETQTVEYEMKEDGIGYIRVEEFDKVTYDQFKAALDDLEGQGMDSLIIDLRGKSRRTAHDSDGYAETVPSGRRDRVYKG